MRTRKTPNMDTIHVVPVAYLGHISNINDGTFLRK